MLLIDKISMHQETSQTSRDFAEDIQDKLVLSHDTRLRYRVFRQRRHPSSADYVGVTVAFEFPVSSSQTLTCRCQEVLIERLLYAESFQRETFRYRPACRRWHEKSTAVLPIRVIAYRRQNMREHSE